LRMILSENRFRLFGIVRSASSSAKADDPVTTAMRDFHRNRGAILDAPL
jgi:hypothetical protein